MGVVLSRPGYEHIAALWEPFGAGAFGEAVRYWTPSERNTQVPAIAGDFLAHLLIWLGVAAALLASAYALFRFQASGRPGRAGRKAAALAEAATPEVAPQALGAPVRPVFDARAARAQLWARTKLDAAQVFKSPAYFVLLGLAAAASVGNLWFSTEVGGYGGKIYPVTRVMIQAVSGVFPFMTLIIAAYYAGELVWREKERRTHEIIDATPASDWMFVAPKTLAISIVTALDAAGRRRRRRSSPRRSRGYDHFQIGDVPALVGDPHRDRPDPDRGAGGLRADPRAPQVRRLGGDGALPDLHHRADQPRLRGQPLPVRQRSEHAGVGHERPRPLLDRRLLVPALLVRLRADAGGAGLRPLAARNRDAAAPALKAAAAATDGRGWRADGRGPDGVRRDRRLGVLQHPCPQSVPHRPRRRQIPGRLREEVPAL